MTEILKAPVTDASAWRGNTVAGETSWIHELSFAQAEALLEATAAARAAGLEPATFGAERFPLPGFGSALRRIYHDLEHGRGFVLIRGLPLDGLDDEDLQLMYAGIGAHLGRMITQNSQGDRIGRVTDRGSD